MNRANGAYGIKSPLACAVTALLALALCAFFSTSTAYAIAGIDEDGNIVQPEPNLPYDWDLVTLDDVVDGQPVGDLPGASKSSSHGLGAQATRETKEMPLLVIVAGFSDVAYSDDWDWSTTIFDSSEGARSISSFYSDMSLGQFTFAPAKESSVSGVNGNTNKHDAANDGIVHVTLDTAHGDWHDVQSTATYATLAPALAQAVTKADKFVDFTAYDANGDKTITTDELAIGFVVAGYEAAYDPDGELHDDSTVLWSHAWDLRYALARGNQSASLVPRPDGVRVSNYIAIAENLMDAQQEPISVLAHELGHYLGLPDLYDTTYAADASWSGYSVNRMSVMAEGAWGRSASGAFQPVAMDVACRETLGWVEPTDANAELVYEVVAQNYSGSDGAGYSALKVATGFDGEYYLIENRQPDKWDEGLSEYDVFGASSGLIVWHVDRNVARRYSSTANDSSHRPAIMPLYPERDIDDNVTFIGDFPNTGCPFFSKDIWESEYASLGESLLLPVYGAEDVTADPSSRTLSDLALTFSDSSSSSMHVALGCGHELIHHAAVAPTCTEGGSLEYWKCSKCLHLYSDEGAEVETSESAVTLRPLGHDIGLKEAVEATCTEPGEAQHWECSRCKTKYEDADGELPVKASDLEVAPLGHSTVHVDTVDPTCTSAGNDECWQCFRCKQYFLDEEASALYPASWVFIKPIPHELEGVPAVAATCTEAGSIEHWTCSMCGRIFADAAASREISESDLVAPALGHTWDSGVVTKAATTDEEGEKVYTCTVCGETKVEALSKVTAGSGTGENSGGESRSESGSGVNASAEMGAGKTVGDGTGSGSGSSASSSASSSAATKADSSKVLGADGTAFGAGASLAAIDKAIAALKSDADPKGTAYSALKARATKTAKTSVTLGWSKPAKAKKYVVYGAACGKSNKMKKLATVKKTTLAVKKISGKALAKGKYYKFMVIALNGSDKVVSSSKIIHVATTGGKVTNAKSVTTAASKDKVTLKVGKTFSLKAKQKKASAKLALKTHRKLSYESSNVKVATVTSAGKIKAKAVGTCYVYAYAQNGVYKRVKVTVKSKATAKTTSVLRAAVI